MKKLAAALCGLMLLSGCDYLVSDAESLLRPPTLNDRQAQVYSAVAATLGSEGGSLIHYKYIQSGDYRTPFVFFDMDGDGLDEGMVFYSFQSEPTSIRTKILVQSQDGTWSSHSDFATECDQIDFVRFARMLSTDSHCMVVGWRETGETSTRAPEQYLSIYSFQDGRFETEVKRQPYVDYTIHDFSGNGLDEIAVIARDKNGALSLSVLLAEGRHIVADQSVALYQEVDTVLKTTTGRLWDGTNAIYIDEGLSDGQSVTTEVIRVSPGLLETLVGGLYDEEAGVSSGWEKFQYTFRPRENAALSRDIDGDGVVEVPSPVALPGIQEDGEENLFGLIQLMNLGEAGFEAKDSVLMNQQERYLLYYPDKWQDKVTLVTDNELGEWKLYRIDPDTGEPTVELLRIQAYTGRETELAAGYLLLASRGSRHYTGYIPRTTGEDTAITEAELRIMFQLYD